MMADAPRTIATCTDMDGLLAAFRARAEALNVSRATIDDVSGLQSGYTGKLLANPPIKNVGAMSLGPLLGALGLAIVLVEDADQMRRIKSRMSERNAAQVRNTIVSSRIPRWLFNSRKGRRAVLKRWDSTTPAQRKRIARKAWRTRRKRRAAKVVPAARADLD